MLTLTTGTHRSGGWQDYEIRVRFTRRDVGGWLVVNEANGRILGWLTRYTDCEDGWKGWAARASTSAFRGDEDSEGHILERVPGHLVNSSHSYGLAGVEPVGYGKDRESAATELFTYLVLNYSPALGLGFGRHYEVYPYESRVS